MPTAPTYSDVAIRSAPLPGPQINPGVVNANQMGAQVAETVGRAAGVIQQINLQEREQAARTEYTQANNDATAEDLADYRAAESRRLADAVGAQDEWATAFDKRTQTYAKNMSSPQAREAFLLSRGAARNRYYDQLSKHVSSETDKHDNIVAEQAIETTRQEAVQFRNDPTEVWAAIRRQRTHRYTQMRNKGYTDADIKKQMDRDESATHSAIIETQIEAGDYKGASAYLQANEKRIDPVLVSKLQPAVQKGMDRDYVMNESLRIASMTDDDGSPLNENEIRQHAKDATSDRPDLTEGIVSRAIGERNRIVAAKSQEREELYTKKYRDIQRGAPYDAVVSPQDEDFLLPQQVDALRSRAGVGKSASTTKNLNNVRQTNILREMIDAGKFKDADGVVHTVTPEVIFLEANARGLTAEQYEGLTEYMGKRDVPDALSVTDVNRALTSKGFYKVEDYADKYPDLFEQIQASIPPGKKATDEDIRKVVSQLFAEGESKGGGYGYGKDMTYIEAKKRGLEDEWLPNLSEQEAKGMQYIFDLKETAYDKDGIVFRRAKKYVTDGLPTPIGDDGLPMSVQDAIYMGTIFDKKLAPPKSTPPKGASESAASYDKNQQYQPYRYLMDLNK